MFFQFGRPSLENPCPSTTFLRAQRSSPSLPCISTTAPSYQTFISYPLLCTRKRRERGEARNRVSSFVFAIDGQFYTSMACPPDLPDEYRVFVLSCLYSHKKRYSFCLKHCLRLNNGGYIARGRRVNRLALRLVFHAREERRNPPP